MISVIIAQRNEQYLEPTIGSIVKACGFTAPEIIIVNDGKQQRKPSVPSWVRVETPWDSPRGCMAARDWGILNANHSTCVVIDGHMDFDPGHFDAYHARLLERQRDVPCARCPGLNPVLWQRENHDCAGAFFLWQDGKGTPEGPTALSLKWRYCVDEGEVPAVLGACYGINREWYLDGLQRPWQYGTGWGTDEELLSIANWLCGGRNVVMPFEAAHWFRSQAQVPYPTDSLTIAGSVANRLRLLEMMPMPDAWREELREPIKAKPHIKLMWRQVQQLLDTSDPAEYRSWLSMQARTFENWRALWCANGNPQDNPALIPPGVRTTPVVKRHANVPPVVQAAEPPVATPIPTTTRKPHQPNPVVEDKGIPCPFCRDAFNSKVTHTYPNGNRRRVCGSCRRGFVTVRRPAEVIP